MENATQIKVLPALVYERIAAGEVVERPASVVKELIENSLDARASRIEIELEGGGKALIRVSDDGHGMGPADARLCFTRHATSKIDQFEDLELIRTYGFRGEALPSVGAVAKVRLVTRFRGDEKGSEVVYEGGRLVRFGAAGSPVGTDIVVRELFYNVPARKKFLKSDRAERSACVDVAARMALANPGTAFHLTAGGKSRLALPPADLYHRCADYFKAGHEPLALDYTSPGFGRITGVIWHPNRISRANRSGILIFVNGRSVNDRQVVEAVAAACRGVGAKDRFPQAVVFLKLPGRQVDVNVHPAKSEVKFADDAAVRRLVMAGVTRALSEAGEDLIAATPLGGGEESATRSQPRRDDEYSREPNLRSPREPRVVDGGTGDGVPFTVGRPRGGRVSAGAPPRPLDKPALPDDQLNFTPEAARQLYEEAPYQIQGQFADTFILVEHGDKLLVIDQHAAHERVIYEELAAHDAERPAPSQQLLLPPRIKLDPRRAARVAELLELLSAFGFHVESAAADAFRVLAVPQMVGAGDEERVAREILEELGDVGEDAPLAERRRAALVSISCKAAVKAGDRLNREQLVGLIRRLLASPNKSTCPHGRPTTAELTEAQIRRWFNR